MYDRNLIPIIPIKKDNHDHTVRIFIEWKKLKTMIIRVVLQHLCTLN